MPEETSGKRKRKADAKPQGVIRFGMMAVRGVGEKAVEAIIAERNERGRIHEPLRFHRARRSAAGARARRSKR